MAGPPAGGDRTDKLMNKVYAHQCVAATRPGQSEQTEQGTQFVSDTSCLWEDLHPLVPCRSPVVVLPETFFTWRAGADGGVTQKLSEIVPSVPSFSGGTRKGCGVRVRTA